MAILKDLLEFQFTNAQSLSELLDQEKIVIAKRTSSEIESIAKQKITLINQLNDTDQRIANHPDLPGLQQDDELTELVAQTKALIAECQQVNMVNGEALKRAQLSFNKLNNLMQQSQGKIGMTYTPEGQTRSISTLGTNIKA